jgi:hypothetical protein
MTAEEERLRSLLGTLGDRHTPLPTDSAWLAPRMRRVRRRRTVLAVAASALAATAVAGGVGALAWQRTVAVPATSTPTPAPSSDAVVPWVNEPAQLPAPTRPSPVAPAYLPCRASQLTARAGGGGAAAGNQSTPVVLTNASSTPCSLSGYPTSLVGIRSNGTRRTLRPTHGTMFDFETARPADLRSGQHTELIIATSSGCEALNHPPPVTGDPYVRVRIGIPGGGTITAPAAFDASCGVGVTTFGLPALPDPEPVSSYPGLIGHVQRPERVQAGTTLHYSVTLTNTASTPIRLDPCPVYEESYFVAGEPRSLVLRLNCSTVTMLEPGQNVRYAMEMPISSSTGQAKFGWSMPAANISAGGILQIDAAPAESSASFDPMCSDKPVRPSYVAITCADAGSTAQDLTWTAWAAESAEANGVLFENDCTPTCLGGTKHAYPATFRFYTVRNGRFTTVDIMFDGKGPHGQTRRTAYL